MKKECAVNRFLCVQFSVRDSKFGQVLVIESVDNSGGGYVLGFRIDPASRLKQIIQELRSLHVTQNRNPEFGVIWKSTLEVNQL